MQRFACAIDANRKWAQKNETKTKTQNEKDETHNTNHLATKSAKISVAPIRLEFVRVYTVGPHAQCTLEHRHIF